MVVLVRLGMRDVKKEFFPKISLGRLDDFDDDDEEESSVKEK